MSARIARPHPALPGLPLRVSKLVPEGDIVFVQGAPAYGGYATQSVVVGVPADLAEECRNEVRRTWWRMFPGTMSWLGEPKAPGRVVDILAELRKPGWGSRLGK